MCLFGALDGVNSRSACWPFKSLRSPSYKRVLTFFSSDGLFMTGS